MISSNLQRRSFGLLFLALCLLALGSTASFARPGGASAAEAVSVTPLLISAGTNSPAARDAGMVVVTGDTFTPGGQVYIALYDEWGQRLFENRWTTASPEIFGPNGSIDPARGYQAGGFLRESFDHLCGATVMVRAYDQGTASWSNWLDAQPNC
jgi:hypothetical protein